MSILKKIHLKKNEDRRLRAGHTWIFSNEIDIKETPLKAFLPGEEVWVEAHDKTILGTAYINPHSLIAGRLFSRQRQDRLDEAFFISRIQRALILRENLYNKPFYRLVFSEADGLPGLIVDRFDKILSVQINTAGMDLKTDAIIAALRAVVPDIQDILLRNDSPARLQEGLENYIKAGLGEPPSQVRVEENDVLFDAPLWEGQKTGWFYDHRLNRSRLKDYVKDKEVLDVFSYLGGWGIQAAAYGAKKVTCVDASPLAATFIKNNAELNQLSDKVSCIQDDAFDALKSLAAQNVLFDVIILDPPAFVKKLKDKKEGMLAYQRINELALKLLRPNGILLSCSCSMHMSYEDLLQSIRRAAIRQHDELQVIERGHQAPDHPVHIAIPETDYLKMIILRKL